MAQEQEDQKRQLVEDVLDEVTGDQIASEIMEIVNSTRSLKLTYAQLRKARNGTEIDRLLRRAPVVDLPDIIADLAQRVAGSLLAVFRRLDQLALAFESLEYEDGDEDEELDEDVAVFDEEAIKTLRKRVAGLYALLAFIDMVDAETVYEVPEAVKQASAEIRESLADSEKIIGEQERLLKNDDQEGTPQGPISNVEPDLAPQSPQEVFDDRGDVENLESSQGQNDATGSDDV